MHSPLSIALAYAGRGWPVFPCKPDGKTPACQHGVNDATTDESRIRSWWKAMPAANIGLATGRPSGLYVVDIDRHKDSDGFATLDANGIPITETLTATTPNGGKHLFYHWDGSGDEPPTGANINGWNGVDARGTGGYVVAPGSKIKGKTYSWVDYKAEIAEFPKAYKRAHKPKQPELPTAPTVPRENGQRMADLDRARRWLENTPPSISGQGGHNALMWAAQGIVNGFCLDDGSAMLLLGEFNLRCRPAWSTRELQHKVNEAKAHPIKSLGWLRDAEPPRSYTPQRLHQLANDNDDIAAEDLDSVMTTLADFPDYLPEDRNDDILVRGRWLERGGSAFIVSTAGTGKSILSLQMAMAFTMGRPFAGLSPRKPLRFWILQTEDSPSRITIDREDVTAELSEQIPGVDWRSVWRDIVFVKATGCCGAEFIARLDALLDAARMADRMPDVVILNPFMSFVGGPITDGAYVTPFLRGGAIGREHTSGMQAVIERHRIGLLAFHHTPKPPNQEQLDAWMKSQFPEYQGAGSADITNWGRSFITMMKVKDHPNMVCLTAGKNGGELGWEEIDGARRHYLAWSAASGITGGNRHAWRELSDDEYMQLAMASEYDLKKDADAIAEALCAEPLCQSELEQKGLYNKGSRRQRKAWEWLKENLDRYGLVCATFRGRKLMLYGRPNMVLEAARIQVKNHGWKESDITVSGNGGTRWREVATTNGNIDGGKGGSTPPIGGAATATKISPDRHHDPATLERDAMGDLAVEMEELRI